MTNNIILPPEIKAIDISGDLPRHKTKKNSKRKLNQVKQIVVHCTDADWTIEQLNQYDIGPNHISKTGCASITYHDVIMKDGTLYHTLPYEEISWHVGNFNPISIGVSLMLLVTDSKTKKDTYGPTEEVMNTLIYHLSELCLELGIIPDRVVGHRELEGTGWIYNSKGEKVLLKTCPGLKINLNELRRYIAVHMQAVLYMKGIYSGSIDGIFGPKSQIAFTEYLKIP